MFYLIATPIGNLGDITQRALDTLAEVDYLLAEDTRVTRVLLSRFEIRTRLVSYHRFNEKEKAPRIIQDLQEGKKVGLVSDAGMPLLQDPGAHLLSLCIQNHIPLTCIGGISSITVALCLSGFETTPFQFVGFMPKKQGQREAWIRRVLAFDGTTVAFITKSDLSSLIPLFPDNVNVALVRELTKMHETVLRGSLKEVLKECIPKGEMVLVIERMHTPPSALQAEALEALLSEEFPAYKAKRLATKWAKKLTT